MKIIFIGAFPELAAKLKMMITPQEEAIFFLKAIRETVDFREKNKVERNDFLNMLINMKNRGTLHSDNPEMNDKITFNELAAQAFLFFLAGFETSSTTMTFCLYELAQNQEVQSKLRDEISSALDENEGKLDYESVMNLKYLQMVIDGEDII
jgi:cytochrome P450 family 6